MIYLFGCKQLLGAFTFWFYKIWTQRFVDYTI